uniref:Amino acid transporter transmembrane domain-containing protein n=2 Tax=Tetranychus urticae TaxID=32264 RepID=T1JQJ5_TETUR
MAGHLFFGFLLMINPAVQEIENKFKAPRSFNWKRVAIRVLMLLFILFICESIPRFGKLLDLVGGSSMTCLAYIFPPLFYVKLCSMKNPSWPERRISLFEKLHCYKIIIIGIIGGVCATVAAIVAILSPGTFVLPCYIDLNCTNE